MERYACLQAIAPLLGDALVISCIGGTRTEWNALAAHPDFTCHAMGLTSSTALGLALALPDRQVVALDGDGGLLMNLSTLTTIGAMQPPNLLHVVFDNGSYESSGKGPTHTTRGTDLVGVALACSYPHAAWAESVAAFRALVEQALGRPGLALVAAKVTASTADVPNTRFDNTEQKYLFARYVEASSGIEVLRVAPPAHTVESPAR
ncbi:MAG TPA: thiamine pyrophosphate-dependent enzyme [Chloroflexota bacterium]|jgi:thiamine pyrophosphate-dependent acetolactate synthase large subunit-like protein